MNQSVLLLLWVISNLLPGIKTSSLPSVSTQTKHAPRALPTQGNADPNLPSYEIITPIKVTEQGRFLSNDLTHAHEFKSGGFAPRRKRETTRNEINEETGEGKVHYSLHIEGKHHIVELQPNHVFLPPHAVLERRSKFNSTSDDVTVKIGRMTSRVSVIGTLPRCHLVGRVFNHTYSKVALSTCEGLKGYLKTDEGEFLIEPLQSVNRTNDQPHPHVVYRRSLTSSQSQSDEEEKVECAAEKYTDAMMARQAWEELKAQSTVETRDDDEDHDKPKRRSKRSVSVERNVEALIVADKEMIDFYSNEDLNTYILTIMNMVSSIFHDASIGNAVNIIVVRIMLLETPQYEEELDISHHADNTLVSFCKWQEMVNPTSEDHPHHHDVALLLTRYNICSRSSASHCSTLGLAEIAGMCQPNRSCNVNEDTGLQIAYTIAHEIGHNFGMDHDSFGNGCGTTYGVSQHVMSPHLATDAIPMTWSNCSRNEITTFLDRDWGRCLVDEPHKVEYNFPQLPPGAMYDANHQCRLTFGAKAYHCKAESMECQTLWCRVNNRCVTRLEAAADGTQCGKHKWCYYGKCVTMGERPEAIHGSWGQWSPWSACSRSCGAGVKVASRHCNNPSPANGGKYCTGDRRKYRICNTEDCPENGVSFRAVQCSEFDNQKYKGNNHTWGPVTHENNPCQLHCKPDNEFYSVELKNTVVDGTPCKPGTRDMCIHGVCKRIACDWTIEGNAQEDRCGLCHGDGTQCVTTTGYFNVTHGVSYVNMVTLPMGVKNARIEEVGNAANYLAVRDEATGEFYLNGNWIIQWSGEYGASGLMMYYKRENETETLFFPGPLKKPLIVMLLFQTENPGVLWEYTLPHENATYTPEFNWKSSDWSACTRTCGGGTQWSKAQCLEKEAGLVEDKYCENKTRPQDEIRSCNTHACPAWWWSGPWQPCSVTCGEGGTRRRTVICVRSYGPTEQMALMDSHCSMNQKPHEEEECPDTSPCLTDMSWTVGPWAETCRGDPCEFERRAVLCNAAQGPCDPLTRPPDRRQCGNITCGYWQVSEWGECSVTCGEGFQIRNVECINGVTCAQAEEPGSVKECKMTDCDPVMIEDTLAEIYNEIEPNLSNKITPDPQSSTTHPAQSVPGVHLEDSHSISQQNLGFGQTNENEKLDTADSTFINNELPEETYPEIFVETGDEPQISDSKKEMAHENGNINKTEINDLGFSSSKKETVKRDDTISSPLNVTFDDETQTEEEVEKKTEGEDAGKERNIKENSTKMNKETIVPEGNDAITPQGDTRDLANGSIDDSKYDSPSYYEATPDEYYDFEDGEVANNESVDDERGEEADKNTNTDKEDEESEAKDLQVEVNQNIKIGVNETKNETDFKDERSHENDVRKKNENDLTEGKTGNEMKEENKQNVINDEITIENVNKKQNNSKVPSKSEKKNNIKFEVYNDAEYNYDDYHNFNNIFHEVNESTTITNTTLMERPQGFVEDKLDIDDVQVIEIKLKKNKSKKRRHQEKKEKIKKIKVHTGADAIRVLNKFTKKANSKKTPPPPPTSSENDQTSLPPFLKWTMGPWTECSEACGAGFQRRAIECQNSSSGNFLPPWKCHVLPPPDLQSCNKFRCLNWTVTPFDQCSVTCGSGIRSRNASCPKENRCHHRDLPHLQEKCVEPACVQWVQGPWSMCTKSCGGGYQIRFVKCVDVDTQEASQECEGERPPHKRMCNASKCQKKRQSHQSHCKDSLDTKLCRRLVHMCSTKFVRIKCCRTCHRERGQ